MLAVPWPFFGSVSRLLKKKYSACNFHYKKPSKTRRYPGHYEEGQVMENHLGHVTVQTSFLIFTSVSTLNPCSEENKNGAYGQSQHVASQQERVMLFINCKISSCAASASGDTLGLSLWCESALRRWAFSIVGSFWAPLNVGLPDTVH